MPPRFIRELISRRETRAPLGAVVVALKSLTWVQWAQFWSGSVSYLHRASRYYLYHITIAGLLGRAMPSISSQYRSRYRSCLNNSEGQRVRSYALSLPLIFAPLMYDSDMVKDNRLNVDAFIPIGRCRKYHICYSPLSLPFLR
jgi:hypothetical protein